MADDIEIDTDALQRRMDGAMNALKHEFASLRTGRASASIVDAIQVEAYGQMTPITQLGTVNVPEPRMVVINVWDKGMINKVEKAIRDSGLGITETALAAGPGRVAVPVVVAVEGQAVTVGAEWVALGVVAPPQTGQGQGIIRVVAEFDGA